MNNLYLKLRAKCQNMISSEEGQDLVEYALLVSLISVAAIVFLPALATAVSGVFSAVEADL